MLEGTIIEKMLREAVVICLDEYSKQKKLRGAKESLQDESQLRRSQLPRLISVKDWEKVHGYPQPSGLRHLMFYGKQNGFERCVRRIGRRVFIDEAEYFKWVTEKNEATSS